MALSPDAVALPDLGSIAVQRAPEVDVRVPDEAVMGTLEAGTHAVDVMGDVDLDDATLVVIARQPDARGVGHGGRIRLQGEVEQMAVGIGPAPLVRRQRVDHAVGEADGIASLATVVE